MIFGPDVQLTRRPFDNHATLADNISAYWKFEETTSALGFADSVKGLRLQSQSSAIYVISTTEGQIGRGISSTTFGNSLYTDSTSTSTSPKSSFFYSLATDRTVTFWTKPHISTSTGYYIQNTSVLSSNWNVSYTSGSETGVYTAQVFGTYLGSSESNYESVTAVTSAVAADTWQFVTVQYLLAERQIRIQVNRNAWVTSTALTSDAYPSVSSSRTMFFTKNDHYMDEMGSWPRRLTDNELDALYNGGVGLTY